MTSTIRSRAGRRATMGRSRASPQPAPPAVAGWDIGGAHLACALAQDGAIVDAFQLAAPLWTGLEALGAAFAQALERIGPVAAHAVTMTGELSDLFEDREHGVRCLAEFAAARLPAVRVYAGSGGFIAAQAAGARHAEVASANWHATASLVARTVRDALLIDIGSTTADLIPVAAGAVAARGHTDAQRLVAGELLYTGATRTPVMAVCERAPFAGEWHTLVAEHFATMADVRRLTGELAAGRDRAPTADRRGRSARESRVRLARMIARDAGEAPDPAWDALARYIAERQLARLVEAGALVLSRAEMAPDAPIIGAGIGRFLSRAAANRLARRYVDFETLIPARSRIRSAASDVAPACAVALLAQAPGLIPAGRRGGHGSSR